MNIAMNAFKNCTNLTSITFGNNFNGNIYIPDNKKHQLYTVFYESGLTDVYLTDTALNNINEKLQNSWSMKLDYGENKYFFGKYVTIHEIKLTNT